MNEELKTMLVIWLAIGFLFAVVLTNALRGRPCETLYVDYVFVGLTKITCKVGE